jgi:hypothetical protein
MEIPYLKKAFDSKIMSNYRKASLSQKIRRDLLKSYILFPDQLESSKKLVTEFNFLTHEKYKSPEEIFYHSFCKDFQDDFLNTKNLNYKKANYTSSARIIVDFFNKLQSKHLILFLHGSHADGETVNYSDVDATLILKRSAFDHLIKTRSDIFAINNFLRQFDLDTHHSTFLTLEDDFKYYPESFMPVSVFEKSIRDQNNNISQIYARTSYDLSLDSFFNLSIRVLTLIKELSNFNSINLKSIISEYFMIIILYEQVSSNNFNDKKSIFLNILKNKRKLEKLNAFSICSKIRKSWPNQTQLNTFGVSKTFLNKITTDILYLNAEIKKSRNYNKVIKKL